MKTTCRFAAAAATLALSAGASAADVEIVYGAYGSPTSTLVGDGVIPFLDEMKARSNGSMDYTLHSGGAVVGVTTTLPAIRDGLVDGGMVSGISHPSELPINTVLINLSPSLTTDARAAAAALTETVVLNCQDCMDEMKQWNVQYLAAYALPSYNLLCSEPLDSWEDIQGKRVRATGAFGRLAEALGAVPVNTTISETYEGLQRGQLDCTVGSPGWVNTFSFADVTKNFLMLRQGNPISGPMLNLSVDKWESLSAEQKQVVIEASAVGLASAAYAYEAADQVVLNNADEQGYRVFEADERIREALAGFGAENTARVIEEAESRGIDNAREMVDAFMTSLEKWEGIVGEVGDDQDAYIQALHREIYQHYPL